MTVRTTTDKSHWDDRPRPISVGLFCPPQGHGAHQERPRNRTGGHHSKKTKCQSRPRNEETGGGRAQGSEPAAAHDHFHGAAARKAAGVIAWLGAAAGFT